MVDSLNPVKYIFDPNRETKVIVDGLNKDGVASMLTKKDPETDL